MYSFTELAKVAGCLVVALLVVWRCSRQPTPPLAEFSRPHPVSLDSLLPTQPLPVRDTVSLSGLRALVRQDYRQENFGQLQRDAGLLVAHYPTTAVARRLAAQRPTIDSLAQAARQREARKQQRRAQAADPNAEWAAAYPEQHWYTKQYDSDFAEDAKRTFLTHSSFYGDCTQSGTTTPVVATMQVDSASALHVLLSSETLHPAVASYRVGRGLGRRYVGGRPAYTTSQRITVAEPATYAVEVRAEDGHAYHLRATNALDQLDFDAPSSRTLHQLLKQGGMLRLVFIQAAPRIRYRFTIANADDYEAGYLEFRSQ